MHPNNMTGAGETRRQSLKTLLLSWSWNWECHCDPYLFIIFSHKGYCKKDWWACLSVLVFSVLPLEHHGNNENPELKVRYVHHPGRSVVASKPCIRHFRLKQSCIWSYLKLLNWTSTLTISVTLPANCGSIQDAQYWCSVHYGNSLYYWHLKKLMFFGIS